MPLTYTLMSSSICDGAGASVGFAVVVGCIVVIFPVTP
jgi:hypothetical protein